MLVSVCLYPCSLFIVSDNNMLILNNLTFVMSVVEVRPFKKNWYIVPKVITHFDF
jgi:hypothetical protein